MEHRKGSFSVLETVKIRTNRQKVMSAYCLKQIDSILPSVCPGIDHRILLYVVELLMFNEPPRFLRNDFIHVKICCRNLYFICNA